MAELIRKKLSGIGVEVDTQVTNFSTLQQNGEDGSLEMYSLGWGGAGRTSPTATSASSRRTPTLPRCRTKRTATTSTGKRTWKTRPERHTAVTASPAL